jgi:centromere/kinetochore protein ZW10
VIAHIQERIHERIHTDVPSFDRQLESSKSVQTRLHSLIANVDSLSLTISDPQVPTSINKSYISSFLIQTGLIPILVKSLTSHASLAQNSSDADITYEVLSYLLRCRVEFNTLSSLILDGRLPQAVEACGALDLLLDKPPIPLDHSDILLDLRVSSQSFYC